MDIRLAFARQVQVHISGHYVPLSRSVLEARVRLEVANRGDEVTGVLK
jgi:hypothetical protein